jgi:hypothetical protein
MNLELELSEALHCTLDLAQPSADLHGRILARAVAQRRSPRPRLRLALAGLTAAVAILVVIPFVIGLRSSGPEADTTAVQLAHHSRGDLALDYPESWKVKDDLGITSDLQLWTGTDPVSCGAPESILATVPNDARCGSDYMLAPGQVIVRISKYFVGVPLTAIDPNDPRALEPGQRYVTVGGMPAIFEDVVMPDSTAAESLDWVLSAPGQPDYRFSVHAEFRNPTADSLRAQVEAVVASIRYTTSVPALDSAAGPALLSTWLDKVRAADPAYACFPDVPGTFAAATVTALPFESELTKPLPVTCSTTIEPTAIGLWKVTLTESWIAAGDRSAGSLTTIGWLNPDGTQNALQPAADPQSPQPSIPYLP